MLIASIEVKGSMRGIKHRVLRVAKSGNLKDESGMACRAVIHPREVEWEVRLQYLSLIHISEPTRQAEIS